MPVISGRHSFNFFSNIYRNLLSWKTFAPFICWASFIRGIYRRILIYLYTFKVFHKNNVFLWYISFYGLTFITLNLCFIICLNILNAICADLSLLLPAPTALPVLGRKFTGTSIYEILARMM